MAVITETPDGLLVTAKAELRSGWARMMLVGLLSPFDGVFDLCSNITIPRNHLPKGFNLNPPPDETLSLKCAVATPTLKEATVQKLRENFSNRMAPEEVAESIRLLVAEGMTSEEIVAETGASPSTVYRATRGTHMSAEAEPVLATAVS